MSFRTEHKKEYRIWKAMRARCYAPCFSNSNYQKKGIKVCERWNDFLNFYTDMGDCPDNYSIDRIDNNRDYSLENCRWTSYETQAKNRGKFNLIYTFNGITQCLKDWAREYGISYTTLIARIFRYNIPFEKALTFIDDRDKPIEWNGKLWSRQELCNAYNIPLVNFYDRTHKGWSLEKILLTPVKTN